MSTFPVLLNSQCAFESPGELDKVQILIQFVWDVTEHLQFLQVPR